MRPASVCCNYCGCTPDHPLVSRQYNHIACRARNAGWQRFRVTVIAVVFFVVGILVWVGSWVGLVPKQFTWICILGFLNPYNMCSSRSPELMRGILGEFGFFYMTAALLVLFCAFGDMMSWDVRCGGVAVFATNMIALLTTDATVSAFEQTKAKWLIGIFGVSMTICMLILLVLGIEGDYTRDRVIGIDYNNGSDWSFYLRDELELGPLKSNTSYALNETTGSGASVADDSKRVAFRWFVSTKLLAIFALAKLLIWLLMCTYRKTRYPTALMTITSRIVRERTTMADFNLRIKSVHHCRKISSTNPFGQNYKSQNKLSPVQTKPSPMKPQRSQQDSGGGYRLGRTPTSTQGNGFRGVTHSQVGDTALPQNHFAGQTRFMVLSVEDQYAQPTRFELSNNEDGVVDFTFFVLWCGGTVGAQVVLFVDAPTPWAPVGCVLACAPLTLLLALSLHRKFLMKILRQFETIYLIGINLFAAVCAVFVFASTGARPSAPHHKAHTNKHPIVICLLHFAVGNNARACGVCVTQIVNLIHDTLPWGVGEKKSRELHVHHL